MHKLYRENSNIVSLYLAMHKYSNLLGGALIVNLISKQILHDPKFFLNGWKPEKHNFSKKEQTFIDLSLLYAKKISRTAIEIHSQTKNYSKDKTDVIGDPSRKDNVYTEGQTACISKYMETPHYFCQGLNRWSGECLISVDRADSEACIIYLFIYVF